MSRGAIDEVARLGALDRTRGVQAALVGARVDLGILGALELCKGSERREGQDRGGGADSGTARHTRRVDLEGVGVGDEEGSGEEESEDEEGVRVGKFGKLEVVADEDMADEEGAEAFDQDAYRRAMAGLQRGVCVVGGTPSWTAWRIPIPTKDAHRLLTARG